MDNPFFYLALGILLAWAVSFLYSFQVSRRKLTLLARWLEPALPMLGNQINSSWKGNNTLTITVGRGKGIVREAAFVLGVQSKVLFSMLVSLVRGGKDSLTILVSINPPTRAGAEFEIFEANAPVPRTLLKLPPDWRIEDHGRGAPYKIAFRESTARDSAYRLIALLQDDHYFIRRISIRSSTPHLMLVFNVPRYPTGRAEDFIQLLRNLAEEVSQPSIRDRDKDKSGSNKPDKPSRPPLRKEPAKSNEPRKIIQGRFPNGHRSLNGHNGHKPPEE
jgi:hypothetical protein